MIDARCGITDCTELCHVGISGRLVELVANLFLGIIRTVATFIGLSLIDDPNAGGRRTIMLQSIAGTASFMSLLSIATFMPKSDAASCEYSLSLVQYS